MNALSWFDIGEKIYLSGKLFTIVLLYLTFLVYQSVTLMSSIIFLSQCFT